ncbi:hypothetical protein [Endozoicomonas acroporae]|uniref:hypothetical protein n=1 Tax=Endozoicomonas acroporae TaxID=1701104 RepID=UPI003D78B358
MANPFPSLPPALPPVVGSSSEALLSADQGTSCPPSATASTFDSRSTAIALSKRYQLQILGYSERDISDVEKALHDLVKNYPADAKSIKKGMYLDFSVFFRLVRDIWLDALSAVNTGAMDRVSHLMVSSTYWLHRSSDVLYLERYRDSLDVRLMHAYSMNHEDLSALAFHLVTYPRKWQENYKHIFRQLLNHVFSSQESRLMNHFDDWGVDPVSQLKVSRWAESELIQDTARTMHFLKDIAQYIDKHKARCLRGMAFSSQSIEYGEYFEKGTGQLLSPIISTDLSNSFPLEETREVLADFFKGKASWEAVREFMRV